MMCPAVDDPTVVDNHVLRERRSEHDDTARGLLISADNAPRPFRQPRRCQNVAEPGAERDAMGGYYPRAEYLAVRGDFKTSAVAGAG